jgi:hypothetical protein
VAKVEDQTPGSDELTPLGEEPIAAEQAAEAEPVALAAPAEEVEAAAKVPDGEPPRLRGEKQGPSKLPVYLPAACALALPLIALGIAASGAIFYSTAVCIIVVGYIPLALWAARRTNSVFVVLLGCALAALLVGVYCLWMELASCKFDIKAQEAKQKKVSMTWPVPDRGGEKC